MDQTVKGWIERKYNADAPIAKEFAEYDRMVNMEWELPANWATYSWVRKRVSTAAADVIKQSCNIFDTFNPKFEILPRGPEDEKYAEELERWGEFQMNRA